MHSNNVDVKHTLLEPQCILCYSVERHLILMMRMQPFAMYGWAAGNTGYQEPKRTFNIRASTNVRSLEGKREREKFMG